MVIYGTEEIVEKLKLDESEFASSLRNEFERKIIADLAFIQKL